jgi:sulfatase maturation enzyme AslB (radical SAM superfamily)
MKNVNTIAIYLGDTCNFNCTYCDRDYIKDLGGQNMSKHYIRLLKNFFYHAFKDPNCKVDRIALHGGEPFLYVKRMDEILEELKDDYLDAKGLYISITTNASLFEKEQWFLEKWRKYLKFTISYDFIYQKENREDFDIYKSIELCNYYNIPIHWQFVMPVADRRVFSLDCIKDILDKLSRCKVRSINLIPLRHHRGGAKFKTFVEELNLAQYADSFHRFVSVLYNYNIMVFIDGNYGVTDKAYFGDHYKMILSPDGYIYSEYDFCEYKRPEYQVGRWTDGLSPNFVPVFNRNGEPDDIVYDKCKTCKSANICGLRYLHKMFDTPPGEQCVTFYQIQDAMVKYTTKLHSKKSFFHWIADATSTTNN